MRIAHAEIANYRALESVSIPLTQFGVLIGENDVGKTSFLYALDRFFACRKAEDPGEWFKQDVQRDIRIVLTFDDLAEDPELEGVRRADGRIVVSRVFKRGQTPVTKAILADQSAIDVAKPIQSKYFGPDNFHFIPVRRDLSVQFSMNKTALLGKTLRASMKKKLEAGEGGDAVLEVEETLRSAIEQPRAALEKFLCEQMHNTSLRLSFDDLEVDPVEGVSFEVNLADDKVNDVQIQNRGAGTQNNLIIALFRLIASLELGRNFIFAMEEPENSLHPKAQRQLLDVIQQISNQNQVIVTTHSPVFIDRSDFASNTLLTRTVVGNTMAKTFAKEMLGELRKDLGIRASDALLKGGGNCALIVEGSTEEEGFPVMFEMLGISEFELGIAIVKVGGSDFQKIEGTCKLLKAYDIPCVIVLDKDAEACAEDVRRAAERGALSNVRRVFCLSRGCIEDYYPSAVIAEVINEQLSPTVPLLSGDIPSDESGLRRLSSIKRVMYEKGAGESIEYLKVLLGRFGTRKLQAQAMPIDPELVDIFECVRLEASR